MMLAETSCCVNALCFRTIYYKNGTDHVVKWDMRQLGIGPLGRLYVPEQNRGARRDQVWAGAGRLIPNLRRYYRPIAS